MQEHTQKFLRMRKALVRLPILCMAFLIVIFYLLGGGGAKASEASAEKSNGFNTQLPGPHFAKKADAPNKLVIYNQAAQDSMKRAEKMKQDPYHRKTIQGPALRTPGRNAQTITGPAPSGLITDPGSPGTANPDADKLLEKLNRLKGMVGQPAAGPAKKNPHNEFPGKGFPGKEFSSSEASLKEADPVASRLNRLMQSVKEDTSGDPQLDRLNGMLDKIIRIQHAGEGPASVPQDSMLPRTDALKMTSGGGTAMENELITAGRDLDSVLDKDWAGFYSIDDPEPADSSTHNTIMAVVREDQELQAGSTIKLSLSEDAQIRGVSIPAGSPVFGKVSLNNDRMLVTIHSIGYNHSVYPVALQVYDLDGLEGIYIPGAIGRDVMKQSADQGINSIGLGTYDPSVAAQAATAGIQAAKSLFSKKIRIVRISVKAGYQVLLWNGDQRK